MYKAFYGLLYRLNRKYVSLNVVPNSKSPL